MSAGWEIRLGDCVEQMASLEAESVDAVVCDPPYGLEFMGKDWDRLAATPGYNERGRITDRPDAQVPYGRGGGVNSYQAGRPMQEWHEAWAREALRVLKPGGHLLAFGGTRTYHRLACAVEDAGFEIRDCLTWLYGSGFPKSLDVGKAIDKAAGAERAVVGERTYGDGQTYAGGERAGRSAGAMGEAVPREPSMDTAPATPEAERWDGWGTALKPAHEPIVVARKPLSGTVAANVLEHGTGGLNIDACRIESEPWTRPGGERAGTSGGMMGEAVPREPSTSNAAGRWPANVVLDEEAADQLDAQTGELVGGTAVGGLHRRSNQDANCYGHFKGERTEGDVTYGDTGGASRFFYVAKAGRAERNAGLEGFPEREQRDTYGDGLQGPRPHTTDDYEWQRKGARNSHPTVKPIALMRWLVRLVTPPGGTVLDPFTGSGTTGCACLVEGLNFIGCEREPEYVEIAKARMAYWADPVKAEAALAVEQAAEERRDRDEAAGALSLFEEGAT